MLVKSEDGTRAMEQMIFVSLPVTDLARSKTFYAAIGATNNPQFTNVHRQAQVLLQLSRSADPDGHIRGVMWMDVAAMAAAANA